MKRAYLTPNLMVLALILSFIVTGVETAAEEFSGLSGKVVDLEGNAVPGFTLAVRPVQLHDGFLEPERGDPTALSREKRIRWELSLSVIYSRGLFN